MKDYGSSHGLGHRIIQRSNIKCISAMIFLGEYCYEAS